MTHFRRYCFTIIVREFPSASPLGVCYTKIQHTGNTRLLQDLKLNPIDFVFLRPMLIWHFDRCFNRDRKWTNVFDEEPFDLVIIEFSPKYVSEWNILCLLVLSGRQTMQYTLCVYITVNTISVVLFYRCEMTKGATLNIGFTLETKISPVWKPWVKFTPPSHTSS